MTHLSLPRQIIYMCGVPFIVAFYSILCMYQIGKGCIKIARGQRP